MTNSLQSYLTPQAWQELQAERLIRRARARQSAARPFVVRAPHSEKQAQIVKFPGHVVAFCGRRFGKTDGNVARIYHWLPQRPGLYWWVGLSWRSASLKRAWREVTAVARRWLAAQGLDERGHINNTNHEIKLPGLGEIWFRTADNPPSLAGEGVMGVVLDEFSLMQEVVWTEYVQATLLDYDGWASFGGVPKGNNWAAALWRGAADKPGWLQLHATSYDNPHIAAEAIDSIRSDGNTPEFFFRQEYLAEILSAEGMVFRRITEASTATAQTGPLAGRSYVAGVDVADAADFTVISILDADSREQVYIDRFNQVGYVALEDRLEAAYRRWGVQTMVVEDNSIGQPVIDHLRNRGMNIISFHTSATTKAPLIQALQSAFEHGEIRILNDPVQLGELQAYEGRRLASGMSYSAPAGLHDDMVMALAFAWWGVAGNMPALL